ncbi:MAG TPA: CGNR zinc finger domain-containing protein [Streptosporangiaceae bacterium]|nr:CGNR zinc finger domain-containing protein [Streptosporangiaceae bacterium]
MRARIRQCAGPACSLVFGNTSRPGRRRWRSMERCGNIGKQRHLALGYRSARCSALTEGPDSPNQPAPKGLVCGWPGLAGAAAPAWPGSRPSRQPSARAADPGSTMI